MTNIYLPSAGPDSSQQFLADREKQSGQYLDRCYRDFDKIAARRDARK